jgi:ABC-type glycerol-3-phosphate transport system substrate-binding protein
MAVTGNWEAASIREYAPKLDWGVTYLPVAKPGGRPFTWSGGYGLAMPKGSRNPGDAWTVMKEFAGREGQRIFSIGTSHLPTYQSLLKEKRVVRGQEFFAKMLDHSRVRQPLPVASTLWDALSSARDAVLLGDRRPAQALAEASDRVNPGMAQYCPFRLPPGS